uniref:Uncharacterized protein n=2 Tax=Tetraselmis sp. GSL018 TaxID=582737 RepID=A0A061RH87_9CHLO|mmetsp:Transcript_13308/g.31510  ORF Transcript_13308/g.31510 Transcript_13308/m.31510 type:complete len:231 (+) Transcript_13308:76-768(+)
MLTIGVSRCNIPVTFPTKAPATRARCLVGRLSAVQAKALSEDSHTSKNAFDKACCLVGAATVALTLSVSPAFGAARLPPIDNDPNRCERAFVGNTIGQANAVSDKVLDLRKCTLDGADLSQKTLAGAYMSETSFKGANLTEAVLTKAYAANSNLEGANLSNSVLDRVDFTDSNLKGANFTNSVITSVVFTGANLEDANFEDVLIGSQDAKELCTNPTLKGEARIQVGCRK